MIRLAALATAHSHAFQRKMRGTAQRRGLDPKDDFWTWRAKYAPFTGDDVNRIERPGGTRDWSRAKIDNHRKELTEFEARWKKIESSGWRIPRQVDYRLIGSALSRVHWELDITPRWNRDPNLPRSTADRPGGSVDRARAVRRSAQSRNSHTHRKHSVDPAARRSQPR